VSVAARHEVEAERRWPPFTKGRAVVDPAGEKAAPCSTKGCAGATGPIVTGSGCGTFGPQPFRWSRNQNATETLS
jgi:hypothetical protein